VSAALTIAIAGLGTVGEGVLRVLARHGDDIAARIGRPIAIAGVSARSRRKERAVDVSVFDWYDDPVALAASPGIDVFVELIGGEDGVAKAAVEAALTRGVHVVTANKALLAHHGAALAAMAEKGGSALMFEAAVAGGIPIVKALRESLAANTFSRVYGILNGTCNYILTTMERDGSDFADVLAEAQRLGYAEADPGFDVGGIDTAHKLALLTSLAFGTRVDFASVYVEGIANITAADIEAAADFGYRIKLLGVAQRTDSGIEQRVHPTLVPRGSAIAEVSDAFNAVVVEGDFVGEVMLFGRGAGAEPTASAVVGDIIDVARGDTPPPFGRPTKTLAPYEPAGMRAHEGGYYVGLVVLDRPGAMAAIAGRMADQRISLDSIRQRSGSHLPAGVEPGPVPVTLITHETTEEAVRAALEQIERDGHIVGRAQMIRIEPT
jgi:homoserine dehydrogenase